MKEYTLNLSWEFWGMPRLGKQGVLRNSVSEEFRESSNVSLWIPMYHVSLALSFSFFWPIHSASPFFLILETSINGLT
jgi:hypothetical protein